MTARIETDVLEAWLAGYDAAELAYQTLIEREQPNPDTQPTLSLREALEQRRDMDRQEVEAENLLESLTEKMPSKPELIREILALRRSLERVSRKVRRDDL